ncbi:hypothetical protein QBC40DRAFT_290398 [Triangularia verruculosa]|uniref:C3H1-type domain-containing protein n=1 Tax=Triangularia verruculosa TaxID=2587418 RepID=A0AAN7AQD8_9PEZI|nr:hypothetical protein QBC40DRAFT_290398 [Triangularia verruculosa]
MAPRPFFYIVRPDYQRKTKSGQTQIVRGANVPLIAVDELPDWIEIYGVPRGLPSEQTIGLQGLGLMSKNSEPYLVQLDRRVFAAGREPCQGDDLKGHTVAVAASTPPLSPTGQQATVQQQVPVTNTVSVADPVQQPPRSMPAAVHQTQTGQATQSVRTPPGQTSPAQTSLGQSIRSVQASPGPASQLAQTPPRQPPQPVQTSAPVQASVAQAAPPTPTAPAGLLTSRHAPKPPKSTPAQSSAPAPVVTQSPATPYPPPPPPGTPSSATPAATSQHGASAQQPPAINTTAPNLQALTTHQITTPTVITTPAMTAAAAAPLPPSATATATPTPDTREPCIHYLKWGKCKFKPQCKHSHDITPAALAFAGLNPSSFPDWMKRKLSSSSSSPHHHHHHSSPHHNHHRHLPSSCSSSSSSPSSDSESRSSLPFNKRRNNKRGKRRLQEMQLQLENLALKEKERELKVLLLRERQLMGVSGNGNGNGNGRRARLPKRGSTPLDRERKKLRGLNKVDKEEGKGLLEVVIEGGDKTKKEEDKKERVVVGRLVDI